jgi:acyl carrier protein
MFKNIFNKAKKTTPDESQDFDQVYRMLRDLLPDVKEADLKPDTRLEALGFDSIKYINLVLTLEDVVNMGMEEIVGEIDLASVQTIRDVVNLIGTLRAKKAGR